MISRMLVHYTAGSLHMYKSFNQNNPASYSCYRVNNFSRHEHNYILTRQLNHMNGEFVIKCTEDKTLLSNTRQIDKT